MQKWEYKVVTVNEVIEEIGEKVKQIHLNIYYGDDGWELVAVDNSIAYFKRQVSEIEILYVDDGTGKMRRMK